MEGGGGGAAAARGIEAARERVAAGGLGELETSETPALRSGENNT